MRPITILLICVAMVPSFPSLYAADEAIYLFVASPSTNDLYCRIGTSRPATQLRTTDQLSLSFFTVTNAVLDVFIPKRKYFIKAELWDADGKSLPLTRYGKQFGGDFLNLTKFSESTVERLRGNYRMIFTHPNSAEGLTLFRTEEVFRITRPGKYKLAISVQVYRRPPGNAKAPLELVRFQPVTLNLTKELVSSP